MRSLRVLVLALTAVRVTAGQPQNDAAVSFEAASLKWTPMDKFVATMPGQMPLFLLPMRREGGPGTSDPGRIRATRPLSALVAEAFEVRQEQLRGAELLANGIVELDAVVRPDATLHEAHMMLRKLLVERFGLQIPHRQRSH